MKRYGNLWPQICDRKNIELAAKNAVNGKQLNKARARFLSDKINLLDKLETSLINETYEFKPLHAFTVYEPKQRAIHCSKFYPDKILHHCVMNVIKPLLLEKFSGHLREHKGTRSDDGRKQTKKSFIDKRRCLFFYRLTLGTFTRASTTK